MATTNLMLAVEHDGSLAEPDIARTVQVALARGSVRDRLQDRYGLRVTAVLAVGGPFWPLRMELDDEARPNAPLLQVNLGITGHGIDLAALVPGNENAELCRVALDYFDGCIQVLAWSPGNDGEPDERAELVADVADETGWRELLEMGADA